ncbi:MAG TPA: hypothetical protein VNW26_05405 [Steroidobacteraceae bacterium]|nr:hypothetical protein [Steroidobacteraceae bacterium]
MVAYGAILFFARPTLLSAQSEAAPPCPENPEVSTADLRRRPGAESNSVPTPACDPTRMPPPASISLPEPAAVPDRWRLVEQLGRPVNLLDPYAASNPIKGDRPLFGDEVFLNLAATSNSLFEPRRIPTAERSAGVLPDAIRTATSDQRFWSQTLSVDTVLYKGDTVFRPPDWQFRFTPAINYSATQTGPETASGGVFAVQSLFYERHLRDVSPRYDFDSVRVGIQPLTSDFRGFLLSDPPLAARLFGTRDNNVLQYNIALATRIPKDRVRLNDLNTKIPDDQILLANLYWQDLFKLGTTSEFIFAFNRNRADVPASGAVDGSTPSTPLQVRRAYDVAYLGYSLDGHFGRLNTTAAVYGLAGRENRSMFVDQSSQVRALFAADELSMDFDWRRIRLSMLHASGDGNPYDRRDGGFDTLTSGAIFGGSDSSFFFHERLALAGGVFDLKSRDGLLPSLRPSGNSIESNFSNPGLDALGVGLDLSLTPRWTLSLDANQLWFDKTAPLEALLKQSPLSRRLGAEVVADAIWRPFATQNVVVRLSGAQLFAGPGYRALYGGANPFSAFALLIFNY